MDSNKHSIDDIKKNDDFKDIIEDKKNVKLILVNQLKEFCLSSTTHAIPNIFRSENIFLKIMWIIFFLLSSGVCLYLIVQSFQDFFSYPVTTTVQIINEPKVVFPTISICNINPFKTGNDNITKIYNSTLANVDLNFVPNLKLLTSSRYIKNYTYYQSDEQKKYLYKVLSDMFIFCKFNSFPCDAKDFEWYYNFDYGNCYKFNSNSSNLNYVGKKGMQSSLQLELAVGNYKNSEPYTMNRGIRIVIHNHTDKKVFVADDGIDIKPGITTNIGVKRTIFQKLSQPYSDCIDDLTASNPAKTEIMDLMFNTLSETQYSQKFCQKLCYQRYVEQNANCSDPSIPQIKSGLAYCIKAQDVMEQERNFRKFYSNPDAVCGNSCPIGKKFNLLFCLEFKLV